jgi:microcin C transport system permease protein
MGRLDYLLRRLLLIVPTFLGITFLCYALCRFVPGGPVEQALAEMRGGEEAGGQSSHQQQLSEEHIQQLKSHYGLDQPLLVAYWHWLKAGAGMNVPSTKFPNKSSWELISSRFGVSLIFGLSGFLLTYLICIPLGIAKALKNGQRFDLLSSLLIFGGYSIPSFAFGMVLKLFLCGSSDHFFDVFPHAGFTAAEFDAMTTTEQLFDIVHHMTLPVLCYVIGNFAVLTVLMKNSLLEEISKEYVRTVLAKGGTLNRAIWKHALRNALIPLATGVGSILTLMFSGAVLIEQVFEIPGMGRLSLDAIVSRDYPIFLGILSLTSVLGLLGRILSDLLYMIIDPRIDFGK